MIAILTAGLYPIIHIGRSWLLLLRAALPEPARPVAELPLAADLGRVRHLLLRDGERAVPLHGHAARPGAAGAAGHAAGAGRSTGCCRSGSPAPTASGACSRRPTRSSPAIVIPLAVSVHSVVSWDFAMTLMPGWHSAIFAPVLRRRRHLLRASPWRSCCSAALRRGYQPRALHQGGRTSTCSRSSCSPCRWS